ncbi:MAG: hypothetical protein KME43_07555 [Myxacorys chilensis ATA2-1-KO14]|jgi:hypothetical protein|nr:hypothetical protein [Myxacorys chilensis ATA2-1-KO14]
MTNSSKRPSPEKVEKLASKAALLKQKLDRLDRLEGDLLSLMESCIRSAKKLVKPSFDGDAHAEAAKLNASVRVCDIAWKMLHNELAAENALRDMSTDKE